MSPMTQSFNADITFNNKDSRINAGVTVDVILSSETSEKAIIVERKNLIKIGNDYLVYVLENNVAKLKKVELGKNNGLFTEIKSGLQSGELLITEGQINLDNNVKVKVIN